MGKEGRRAQGEKRIKKEREIESKRKKGENI